MIHCEVDLFAFWHSPGFNRGINELLQDCYKIVINKRKDPDLEISLHNLHI